MLGVMSSRAIVIGAIAGALGTVACAAPPQEESTALVEPEPRPTEDPAADTPAAAEVVPVDEAPTSPEPQPAGAATSSETSASPGPVAASITGLAICDEYLSLYQSCEEHLKPQIMAGDRRFYRAEAASLQHTASTPEAAGLPDACRSMLDRLRLDCPAPRSPRRTSPMRSGGSMCT